MGEQKKEMISEVLKRYIKTKKGNIYQILVDVKSPKSVWLRSGNCKIRTTVKDLKQGLVDGRYVSINEHEWRKWVKEDNKYIEMLTQKLIKRVLLAQLLIELDDELINHYQDDKYFRGLLERSNKASERIACKQYDNLYNVDKETLHNLMRCIDDLTSKCAQLEVIDFPYIHKLIDNYLSNPDESRNETVEFIKIN